MIWHLTTGTKHLDSRLREKTKNKEAPARLARGDSEPCVRQHTVRMISYLRYYWFLLLSSFWFRPSLIALSALPASVAALAIDQSMIIPWLTDSEFLFRSGIEGARQILTAVIGALITVTSLVFSMTVVAVSITASQLGPRIIQLFTKGHITQITLGTLVGNLIFAFVVLRAISGPVTGEDLAPALSLTLAILGTLFNLGLLIYFLHHMAQKIDADAVISTVSGELSDTIRNAVESGVSKTPAQDFDQAREELDHLPHAHITPLYASITGYMEIIETGELLSLAKDHNIVVHVTEKPGRFVIKGTPVGKIYGQTPLEDDLASDILNTVVIGQQRTMAQDIEFSIAAMVEIALRALSPGLNDPFTAITCIDRLAAGMAELMSHGLPKAVFRGGGDELRLIIAPATFQGVFDTAFNGIRQDCAGKISIVTRILEVLTNLAYLVENNEQQEAVLSHADRIMNAAKAISCDNADRVDLDTRIAALTAQLNESGRKTAT